jgi:norsolorinic acid ketoreductase
MEHVNVNAAGVVRLFQAVLPLLQKSTQPKFVVISTGAATIGRMEHVQYPICSYGASKTMVNHITRRIHFENENLIAFPIHPGYAFSPISDLFCRV